MIPSFQTEQENFWAGEFGDAYVDRNQSSALVASNIHLFSLVFAHAQRIDSLIEFGANIGLNLHALQVLKPNMKLAAVEINQKAVEHLREMGDVEVFHSSILNFEPHKQYDCALIKGVLIHQSPDVLPAVYDMLYQSTRRYIVTCDYYNPVPVEVPYHGHAGKLFKRDFAGELLDRFPSLRLVDYGFIYHRDNNFPIGDATWFLLEKCA